MQAFDIPHDKINVNGGAIAMGHPLGATGAMIFGTVLDELERRDLNTALVTLCIGAGMGTATIIERASVLDLRADEGASHLLHRLGGLMTTRISPSKPTPTASRSSPGTCPTAR